MSTIVFPGQGSQFIKMSKDFYDNFDVAKGVFNLICDTTDIDIKNIIFNNPSDLINQTQYTQLAIFCASMSIYEVIKDELDYNFLDVKCMLGHSLGEYTALTAANYISIKDCALLLKSRGQLMQNSYESNKSGMAAVIGMNCITIENIIKKNNLNIEIANDNSPLQDVISGIKEDLVKSEFYLKELGAKKFVFLNVSAAFHSKLMLEAQGKMNNYIESTIFKDSPIAIISNYSGNISNNKEILIQNLSKQMSNRVRWVESIKTLENFKEKNIIEIGPGKVLTGLIKRISNNFNIKNINSIDDFKKFNNGS